MDHTEHQKTQPRGRVGRLARAASKVALGAALVGAGTAHLTTMRREFQAQVPGWLPFDADLVVVASGVVEIGLGLALLLLPKHRVIVGWLTAISDHCMSQRMNPTLSATASVQNSCG